MYAKAGSIERHPSVFVQGQPGIGKSQSVRQIATNLEAKLNKKVNVSDVRLLLFNPVDLRGIPVADMESKEAIWLKPQVFNFDTSEDVINILFLDELTAAPSSLQVAAYQIALDRQLGEHKIPDNTFIIASGNRLEDNAISYEMPTPLRNRFMHFELELDFNSWLVWASENRIHPKIIEFLERNPDKFSTKNLHTTSYIIVTPRSWEFLSDLLYTLGGDIKEHEDYIASIIGVSLTELFLNGKEILSINDILTGKVKDAPETIGELQRVIEVLESEVSLYSRDKEQMANVLNYLSVIPTDYGIRIFRKMISLKDLKYDIAELSGYETFIKKLEGSESR